MSHEVIASLTIMLPEEPVKMTEALAAVCGCWAEMLNGLGKRGVGGEASTFSVNEVRTRAPSSNGTGATRRRPRKASAPAATAPTLIDGEQP